MPISLQRVEVTGEEPVTLEEMKVPLKVDFTYEDAHITGLITAAREQVETLTGRCLVESSWTYQLDAFPYKWQTESAPARATVDRFIEWWANAQAIRIPKSPLKEITSVKYLPSGDASAYATLDTSFYVVDKSSEPATIYPQANQYWPYAFAIKNAVQINFVAGYDKVPEALKRAIRVLVTGWYEHRGDDGGEEKAEAAAARICANYVVQPCGYVR